MTRKIFSLVTDSLCDQEKNENIAVAGSNRDPPNNKSRQPLTPGRHPEAAGRQRGIPNFVHGAFQEGKTEISSRGLRLWI